MKNQLPDATREWEGVLFRKGPAVMGTSGAGSPAAGWGQQTPKAHSQSLWGLSFSCHGPEGLVSPASGGIAQMQDSSGDSAASQEAGPQGETGCVDDGLQVVVGGDQLGRGALAVLGLDGEGLSEDHCQRRLSQVRVQKH